MRDTNDVVAESSRQLTGTDPLPCPQCQSRHYDWQDNKFRCESCGLLVDSLGKPVLQKGKP